MKIATFNVNSINARMENFAEWLKKADPDIVCMQEIKTQNENFPFFELKTLGYNAVANGQKSYNGVAIISKFPIKFVTDKITDLPDEDARYIEVEIEKDGEKYLVISVYVPNGNPPYNNPNDNSKFEYKLFWMQKLYERLKNLLPVYKNIILAGDFNTILTDDDVYNWEKFVDNALFKEPVKQRLKAIEYLGFYDAFRTLYPTEQGYTFWDYMANAWQINHGMRIDYIYLSPALCDKLVYCEVDKNPRKAQKPSDHTPLVVGLRQ